MHFGGSVQDLETAVIVCGNETTSQWLQLSEPVPAVDCEVQGLSVVPGDSVFLFAIGVAVTPVVTSRVSAAGTCSSVVCWNRTTEQKGLAAVDDGAWLCGGGSGIDVGVGEIVQTSVVCIAQEVNVANAARLYEPTPEAQAHAEESDELTASGCHLGGRSSHGSGALLLLVLYLYRPRSRAKLSITEQRVDEPTCSDC